MKKKMLAWSLFLSAFTLCVNAQTDQTSKINIQLSQGIGTSVVKIDGITTRLGTTSSELLGTFQFNENLGIGTGISILALNGSGFKEEGNFNLSRGLIRIPVVLNSTKYLNQKTQFMARAGMFVNHIIEDNYTYLNTSETLTFDNWSLGAQARLGIGYDVRSKVSLGIGYNVQYNFSDFSGNQSEVDSRTSTNTFDLIVTLKL